MLSERRMTNMNARDRLPNRACDAGSGTFRVRARPSISATQTDCPYDFTRNEVMFGLSLCRPLIIPEFPCLFDILVDLDEPAPIRLLCLSVEHYASVAGVETYPNRDEVQHVELAPGSAEKASEIMQTF